MTDWFVHDPADGRVGPLSTDAVRERYRQRRIQRDTLVWHAGMREWQPLDRVSDVVGIDDVVQDASLPPPLPPASAAHPRAAPQQASSAPIAHVAPTPRGLSGCAIAAIVLAVVSIPLLGILAAIALPAYQQYVERSRAAQVRPQDRPFDADRLEDANALARDLIEVAVIAQPAGQTQCPSDFEFESAQLRHPRLQGSVEDGWPVVTLTEDAVGGCAYEVVFHGVGGIAEGKSVRHHVVRANAPLKVICTNLTLPADHLPPDCAP